MQTSSDPDFKLLFETMPGLCLVLSPDLTILTASNSYLAKTVTRREDMIGRNLFNVFPDDPDNKDADKALSLRASLNYVIQHRSPHQMATQRYDFRRPDAVVETYYLSPRNTPVLNDKGELHYIIHSLEDVTEEQIRQKEFDFLSLQIDKARDAIYTVDTELKINNWNQGAKDLFGYGREEVIGKTVAEIGLMNLSYDEINAIQTTIIKNGSWRSEEQFKHKDGAVIYGAVVANLNRNVLGDITALCFVINDISHLKKLEEQLKNANEILEQKVKERTVVLKESEKKYQYLFENNPLPMWVVDVENFCFLAVNEKAIEHYGYSREEFLSMTALDIRPEKDKEAFLNIDRSKRAGTGLNDIGIWDHIKKDGTIIKVRINAHHINFEGRLASVILINDVTEKIKTKEKLQASEKRYRSTLDNMIEGVQIIDFDWKYVYVNKAFTIQARTCEDEFTDYTVLEKFPCLDNSAIYTACQRCFNDRVNVQLEHELEFPDNTKGWFQLSFQPVPEGIFILSVDITERKITEAALAIEKEKLDKIATAAPGLIYSLRKSKEGAFSFTYASNAFEDMVGFSFDEVKNNLEKIFENVHPDQLEGLLHSIKVSAEKMTPWSYEYQYYHQAKGYLWLFGNSIPVKEADGGIIWHGTISDITEIKEAEAALKRSNELFQLATKASSDIVWELNFNTHQYLVYEDKERLFGPDREINWQTGIDADYIVEKDRERIRSSFGNAKNDSAREKWSDEYEVVAADGSILKVINHAIFIRDANGRATRVIGAIKDITQERKLEHELQEQHRKEHQMITAIALEAQEKERNALGMELHDNVNQLLVGTYMLLRMIPGHPEKSDELMETSIEHIKTAIDENRKLAHELVSPDLNSQSLPELIRGLINSTLVKAGLKAAIDCSHYKECSITDKIKLSVYRVVQEQCSNIIKYASARQVSFMLSTIRNTFSMQVKDDGVGMDLKTNVKPNGIGLRNIAARMSVFGGKVSIDSSPGNGFTLGIRIPLHK